MLDYTLTIRGWKIHREYYIVARKIFISSVPLPLSALFAVKNLDASGNMRFISRAEQDISVVRFAHS